MNTAWVVRIVGACMVLAACSDVSDEIPDGDTSMSGTGGHDDGPGGSKTTGGSTAGNAGSGNGGTDGTMAPTCAMDCEAGQICDVDTLTCVCPPDAPDLCASGCVNLMGDNEDQCGECGVPCSATSLCNDGVCSAAPEAIYIAYNKRIWSNLVFSGDTVYWAETGSGPSSGQLRSMALTGGPVTPLEDGLNNVTKLVADSANIYAYENEFERPSKLFRIPLTGGAPELMVTEPADSIIGDIAVQAGVLYYTVHADVKSVPTNATNATGTVVATAAGSPDWLFGLAVDGPLLFWSAQKPESESFSIEGDIIAGGERRTLGDTQDSNYGGQNSLTTDGARVYWASGATLQRRVYDASAEPETIASARGPQIRAFAVNATTAYFTSTPRDGSGASVGERLEKAVFGEKPQGIVRYARETAIGSLVVNESGVYWTLEDRIMRADL